MAVENYDFCRAKLVAGGDVRDDLPTQGGIGREQSEGDQAVRLAAAHRLRQIECAVVAFAGKPLEATPDQEIQSRVK